jgi:hypothetical protein
MPYQTAESPEQASFAHRADCQSAAECHSAPLWGRLAACGGVALRLLTRAVRPIRSVRRLVLALLRELADENAYARHLASHGRTHSGEEWRRFSEERLRAKYARAKCC